MSTENTSDRHSLYATGFKVPCTALYDLQLAGASYRPFPWRQCSAKAKWTSEMEGKLRYSDVIGRVAAWTAAWVAVGRSLLRLVIAPGLL